MKRNDGTAPAAAAEAAAAAAAGNRCGGMWPRLSRVDRGAASKGRERERGRGGQEKSLFTAKREEGEAAERERGGRAIS